MAISRLRLCRRARSGRRIAVHGRRSEPRPASAVVEPAPGRATRARPDDLGCRLALLPLQAPVRPQLIVPALGTKAEVVARRDEFRPPSERKTVSWIGRGPWTFPRGFNAERGRLDGEPCVLGPRDRRDRDPFAWAADRSYDRRMKSCPGSGERRWTRQRRASTEALSADCPDAAPGPARARTGRGSALMPLLPRLAVRLAVILTSLLAATVVSEQSAAHAQQPASRPRVGLALGGGAARGLAHVGVLEWLEEHRIPVDAVAGTSIGGLVAGGYATGRSAAELRAMVAGFDWNRVFRGDVEYSLKSFRRKRDRRGYPVRIEFGLRGGFRMAPSLDPGHEVELLLSRVALPYAVPLEFDDLPIPFRAVATDLEAAEVAELERGSLAQALRATMAIPGVFRPVERDGLLLADGAMLNNVPADVVSRMGVDVVIAVDVSEPLVTREDLQSLFKVASQALGVMMAERTRAVLKRHADHVITPELDDVSADDWREFEAVRALGYEAAEAAGDALAHLALSPPEWERHVEARQARRVPSLVEPQFLKVKGVDRRAADDIGQAVEPVLGAALDPNELELRLTRLAGRGRYGSLGYDLLQDGERTGIGVRARDKPHGPPFLNLAIGLENRAAGLEVSVGTRLTFLDAGTRDAELRFDLALGPDAGARVDYYLPFGRSRLFFGPRAEIHSRRQRVSVEGDPTAGYRTRQALAGVDLGVAFGPRSELRVGYEAGGLDARVQRGAHLLPDVKGVGHGGRVSFRLGCQPEIARILGFRRDWAGSARECAGARRHAGSRSGWQPARQPATVSCWEVGFAPLAPCGRLPPGFSEAFGNSDGLPGGLRRPAAGAVRPPQGRSSAATPVSLAGCFPAEPASVSGRSQSMAGARRRRWPTAAPSCAGRAGGRFQLPLPILVQQSVQQSDQLAHDRDDRDLELLARSTQALVELAQVRIAADGGERGHVQHVAHRLPAAPDPSRPASLPAVPVKGGHARQRGGLRMADGAQLGHLRAQHSSRHDPAAGHRPDDFRTPLQTLLAPHPGRDPGVEAGDVLPDRFDGTAHAVRCIFEVFPGSLPQGVQRLQQIASRSHQVRQLLQRLGLGLGRLPELQAGEHGQHLGVREIVLGLLADRAREVARAARVDHDHLDAGVGEALVQWAVEAPGGFESGPPRALPAGPVAQCAAAALVVVEAARGAGRLDMGVQPGLAHVNADGDLGGCGCSGVHAGILQMAGWTSCAPSLLDAIHRSRFRSGRAGSAAAGDQAHARS